MTLVFLEPAYLWLLCAIPLFWFLPRRATWGHAIVRTAVVAALVFTLARPALLETREDVHHVIVQDLSDSVRDDAVPAIRAAVKAHLSSLPERAPRTLVVLGGDRPPIDESTTPVDDNAPRVISSSSISDALATAARLVPNEALGAVTVVSDGDAVDANWGDAIRQLAERRIPVHAIEVDPTDDDVYPCGIRSTPPLRVGQIARVAVDVVGRADEIVVTLVADDDVLARSAATACPGHATIALEFEPAEAGIIDVEARVEVVSGVDADADNNRFPSSLAIQEPIRAFYLAERLVDSRSRMSDLIGRGVELAEPSAAQLATLARDPEGLAAYDLVIIDDRPAESIPRPVQEAIVRAVQNEGVGLFYAGGKSAFGTGGYFDTPIASILPVEMVQKEEKRDPSTTLVVIIDTSGSMGGERVQLAKECARLAIRRLLPHDKVGIVEFYGTKQWAAPIQSAANAIDIQRAINRLDAGGGTVILPAIEEAFYAMQNVQTRYKHVLVLTDGGVEAGDFETLTRRMTAKGINVSTVLVGGDAHSEFLVDIANWGKGHFYAASNRFNIPEILLKQPSTSKIPPYRPGVHPVSFGGASGWWGDIARPDAPQLAGYVETRSRPGAHVIIETTEEHHPVLTSWRHGLGRVTALATEPVGDGTESWSEWNGYGSWLLRVLSRTAREHPQPFAWTIERDRRGARVIARRLTARRHLPRAERLRDDGTAQELEFEERAPGLFTARLLEEAAVRNMARATLRLQVSATDWPGGAAHLVSPAWHAAAPERNVDPRRSLDLALLASTTGGTHRELAAVTGFRALPGGDGAELRLMRCWPWCLLFALAAYLGDLLVRRWPQRRAAARTTGAAP